MDAVDKLSVCHIFSIVPKRTLTLASILLFLSLGCTCAGISGLHGWRIIRVVLGNYCWRCPEMPCLQLRLVNACKDCAWTFRFRASGSILGVYLKGSPLGVVNQEMGVVLAIPLMVSLGVVMAMVRRMGWTQNWLFRNGWKEQSVSSYVFIRESSWSLWNELLTGGGIHIIRSVDYINCQPDIASA